MLQAWFQQVMRLCRPQLPASMVERACQWCSEYFLKDFWRVTLPTLWSPFESWSHSNKLPTRRSFSVDIFFYRKFRFMKYILKFSLSRSQVAMGGLAIDVPETPMTLHKCTFVGSIEPIYEHGGACAHLYARTHTACFCLHSYT